VKKVNTPIWYLLLMALILVGLVYFCMIRWHIQIQNGIPLDKNIFPVLNMDEIAPGLMPYSVKWNEFDAVMLFFCLILGFVCFVLGAIRSFHKLECKPLFLVAAFSIFFSLYNISADTISGHLFSPEFWYYANKLTMLYAVLLMIHFYDYLCPSVRKWMLPLIFLPLGYEAAAWVMYLGFSLSFHIPNRFYTEVSGVCIVLFLVVGSFTAKSKDTARYIRIIAIAWICWVLYILIISLAGISYYLHDEYKAYMIVTTAFMMCYTLFTNTRELVDYKSRLQAMEMKNQFLMENYQMLENHFLQITQMKHEIRHHLFAIRTLFESGETKQLAKYLADLQDSIAENEEPIVCGNRIVQATLSHAAQLARRLDFEIRFDVLPLPTLPVSDADMVSLFMNLLDNALESCANIKEPSKRWIKVKIKPQTPYLYISVTNARSGEISMNKERYGSTKSTLVPRGQGIAIIKKIVEKHGGLSEFEHTPDIFSAEVLLPLDSDV
jgi:hypothetical protein